MADNSDSVPPRVTFTVKAASNVRCELSMDPAATVSQLKDELAAPDKADVPADRQRLVYAGRVLRNGQRICDYNIKNGHTVHLVRSATSNNNPSGNTAANAATRTPSSSSTTSDPTRAAAAAAAEAQGVPTNIAAGNGNDPLVGLTGARYAGFTQLPGASSLLNPESGVSHDPAPYLLLSSMIVPRTNNPCSAGLGTYPRRHDPPPRKPPVPVHAQRGPFQPATHRSHDTAKPSTAQHGSHCAPHALFARIPPYGDRPQFDATGSANATDNGAYTDGTKRRGCVPRAWNYKHH